MEKPRIFLDTDVLINWIAKEADKNTGFKLWLCPYEIMKLVEAKKVIAFTVDCTPKSGQVVKKHS